MNTCKVCGKPILGTRLVVLPTGHTFVTPSRATYCGVNCRMVNYRAEKKRRMFERTSNAVQSLPSYL